MLAVGRYISQGVYTVAGPFHPFGGAVDIVVVKQEDGTFKSSPWYVKFGKFQGVLKRREKWVDVAVNDVTVPFHMYLDATGEAYFLKDAESDSEETILSPPSAESSGDGTSLEPLAIEAAAAEDGTVIRSQDASGEKSSDQKETEDKGRGVSPLLDQGPATEGGVTTDTGLATLSEHEVIFDSALDPENTDPSLRSNEEEPVADGDNDGKVDQPASLELMASGSKLTVANGVTVAGLTEGGAAIHTLLNEAVGFEGYGGTAGSLLATAALTALAKATAEPSNGLENFPGNIDESPSSLEYLDTVEVEESIGLPNKRTSLPSLHKGPQCSIHLIRAPTASVLEGSNSLDSHLTEEQDLANLELLGNESEYIASRHPILKSVRSDLGADQGVASSLLSTNLMIASADGVIFLEAPTPEVSGEPSSVNLQAQEQTPQGISILQEVDEEELPDISVLTSILELCKKESLDISCDGLEWLHDAQSSIEAEQELSLEGEAKHAKSHALLPGESPHVIEWRTEESERDEKVKSDEQHVIDALISREQSEARGDPKFVVSNIGALSPQEDSEAEVETFVQKASSSQLPDRVDDVDGREAQHVNIAEAHTKSSGLRNGFVDSKRNIMDVCPVLGLQDSILEKRQRASEMQEEQDQTPEKRPRTSELTEVVIESTKLDNKLVVAPPLEGTSRTCTDEGDSSSRLKGLAEQELAWREAMNKASAALRATPPSAIYHRATQSLDRKRKLGSSNSSPKRSLNQSPPQKSTSPAALDRKINLSSSSQKSDTSEHAERKSWGWWGWRGGPAPVKSNSDRDIKKGSTDSKIVTNAVKEPKQESSKAEVKGQTSTSSHDGEEGPGVAGEKSAASSAVRESDTVKTLEDYGLEACRSDTGDSHVETFPKISRGSKSSDSKWRKDGHLLLKTTSTSGKMDAKMEQEDELSDTASSKKPHRPQGRKAEITRRRSILGIVFRGGDQPLPGSDGQSAAELIELERESSLQRAEIVHDLLENSWGYGKGVKIPVRSENVLVPVGTVSSRVTLKGKGGKNEQIQLPDLTTAPHVENHATESAGEKGEHSTDNRGDEAVTRDLGYGFSTELEVRVGPRASEEFVIDSSKREESSDLLYAIGTSGFPSHLSLNDLAGGNQVEDIKHHKTKLDEGNEFQEESAGSHVELDGDVEKACSVTVSDQVENGLPGKELRYPSASGSQDEEDTCNVVSVQDERSSRNELSELPPVQHELVLPCERKKVVSFGRSNENVIPRDDPVELSTDDVFEGRPMTSAAKDPVKVFNVFEAVASPLREVVEVNKGGLAFLSPTDPVSNLENTSENNQKVVGDDKSRSRGEDKVDGTSEKRSSVEREHFLLPDQDVNMEIEAIVSGVASVLPLALDGIQSTKVKLVKTVAVLPVRTDLLATIEAELAEAGETDAEPSTPQEVDELEDELKNRGISKRNIYYDAITSDDDAEEGQGNSLSEDWESNLSRNKTDPISIPGALESTGFKEVFVIARDRPLSESLPDVRLHYAKAEMLDEEKASSRSVGSEPLSLARRNPVVQDSAERFGGHLGDEVLEDKLRHSCREIMDSPLGSGRSGDVSAGEEDVASDEGNERTVETGFELSLCRHLLKAHMGSEEAAKAFASTKISLDDFQSGGSTVVTNDKLVVRVGGQYYSWSVAAPIVLGILAFGKFVFPEKEGAIPVECPKPPPESKPPAVGTLVPTASGGWKLWPFPLRRPKTPEKTNTTKPAVSREALLAAAATAVQSPFVNELLLENGYYKRPRKNKVRTIIPSSQMLAQMNLKEGSNIITFTFFTRMLGRQQVDARIYLWKWNTRIVISDVDGTITKSDVLGQVMPLVGKDWTQSGVARLFSAIKDNGYELLFLSARAISQAYLTRQFLFNVKQDGETLPAGPVVISPDGLFPSLYREVIRRAPHEFKIACLQDIRSLFPKDCNPFYAGFGNRDTDEISYLKVGIPKGKIYIINPKGEVAVNNRTDVRTYTSLHKLVDDMFPAQTFYNEQEDFNSWNYWKMPLIDIDDEFKSASSSKT